jgi:uncharacterized protein involved in outer membrane biogenesis
MMSSADPAPGRKTARLRGWRIVGVVLGVIVALLLGAGFWLRKTYPPERVTALLAEQISVATGRAFRIDGELSIHLLPTISVKASDVVLANADWGSKPDMVRFRRAAFEVSLQDLLERRIRILSIDVDGADLLLETDGQGRFNWQFAPRPRPEAPPGETRVAPPLSLDRLVLSDVRIIYNNTGKHTSREIAIDSLDLVLKDDSDRVTAAFKLGPQRWTAEGDVGRFDRILAGAQEWPFNLRLATDGALVTASGSMGTGPRAGIVEAKLTARADKAAAITPLWAGADMLPMPAEAATNLTGGRGEWRFDAVTLSLGGQAIQGRVTLQTGEPPLRVDADISAEAIDLGKWGAGKPASRPAAAGGRRPLFGDQVILKMEALPPVALRLALKVDRFNVPGAPVLSGLQGRMMMDPGRLSIDPVSFSALGGAFQGRGSLAMGKDGGPRTELQLTARSLSVGAISEQLGGGNHFSGGRANLDVKLAMNGRTPRALAASSTGDVRFSARDVLLAGRSAALDRGIVVRLFDALIPKQAAREDLVVQCVVARLPLRNGVAPIDRSIAMETRQIAVAATGEVNLARQTLSLAFRPRVKKGLDLNPGSLVQLLMLTGPLDDPQFGIDPAGTVRQAATFGVAAATGGLSLLAPALLGEADGTKDCGLEGRSAAQGDKGKKSESNRKFNPLRPFESLR